MRRHLMIFGVLALLVICITLGQNFTPFHGLTWQKELGIHNLIPLSDDEMSLIPQKMNGEDVERMIPLNLTPGSNENTLAQEIARHSVYAFAHYDQLQEFGEAAQKMEKNLTFGSIDGKNSNAKWDVQLMNTRSETQLRYKGDIDLKCNYSYSNQTAGMEVKPSKKGSTSIVIERQMKEDTSSVKMKWNW